MEEWKQIPGYEGLYEASNIGRIRTVEGKTTSNARCPIKHWKQRILKPKWQKRKCGGHRQARVSLWKNGKPKDWLISRLIAMTWCKGYAVGMTVNHIDGNPENDRASNLEWISLADNIRHAFGTGLMTNQRHCVLIDAYGNVTECRSMSAASRFLGRSNGYVSGKAMSGERALSVDGCEYKIVV